MKLLWYGFVGMFAVVGLSLALLNGAGVLFGMGLIGFAALLQMLYLILGELRNSRLFAEQTVEQQKRVADNLEWVMFTPDEQVRQQDTSTRAVKP